MGESQHRFSRQLRRLQGLYFQGSQSIPNVDNRHVPCLKGWRRSFRIDRCRTNGMQVIKIDVHLPVQNIREVTHPMNELPGPVL